MIPIRGITVAVGEWYAKTLAITLPRNARHTVENLVVTTPRDEAVKEVARSVPGTRIYETDDFYFDGSHFNKGLCLERGFDVLGRHGWIMVWDSDCLWPDELPLDGLSTDTLYGARRRLLENPADWTPDLDWRRCPVMADGGPIGHTQLFHADAPCLPKQDPTADVREPWYAVSFTHGGGGDAYFMDTFPHSKRKMLPMDVLHLGPRDAHWMGTSPEKKEIMDAFVVWNGWNRPRLGRRIDPAIVEKVGEIRERVEVPGYRERSYELPFVKRSQVRRQMQQARRPGG